MCTEKPQLIIHIEKPLAYNAFDVKWIPQSCRVAVMGSNPTGTGTMEILEMNSGKLDQIVSVQFPFSLKCGTFRASEVSNRQLAIGDFSGNLQIVDLSRPETPIYNAKAHTGIVNSIDGVGGLGVGQGAPEILTGGSDSIVRVWDPRQADTPVVDIVPHDSSHRPDCWTVAAGNAHSPDSRIIAAGFDNGDVKLFDLRTCKILWQCNLANGVCSLEFDRRDIVMNKLVTTTLSANMHVFDLRTINNNKSLASLTKTVHDSTVWCVKHLPQNRDIWMTTGGNGSLNLHKYKYPVSRTKINGKGRMIGVIGDVEHLNEITSSSQPITGFDWSPDRPGLCAFTAIDQMLRVMIVTKLNTL